MKKLAEMMHELRELRKIILNARYSWIDKEYPSQQLPAYTSTSSGKTTASSLDPWPSTDDSVELNRDVPRSSGKTSSGIPEEYTEKSGGSFIHISRDVLRCLRTVTDRFCSTPREQFRQLNDHHILEMLRFTLDHFKFFQAHPCPTICNACMCIFSLLLVIAMNSGHEAECKKWIIDNKQEIRSIDFGREKSLLHRSIGDFNHEFYPCITLIKLLVEEVKMDVNTEDLNRKTPLHYVSEHFRNGFNMASPITSQMYSIAVILMDGGAHMDAVDISGREASGNLADINPSWKFNKSLMCLAARTIVQHNVPYECRNPPRKLSEFIQQHKRGLKRVQPVTGKAEEENGETNEEKREYHLMELLAQINKAVQRKTIVKYIIENI